MAIQTPFFWGQGGQALTPKEVEQKRQLAELARERAGDTSPVGHWTQGAARVVDALSGVLNDRRADRAEAEGLAAADEFISSNPVLAGLLGTSAPVSDLSGGLPASLVKSESGGNWAALNSEGYGGRGQFGEDRLADAARAGIIPAGMTGADYAQAPAEVQLAVENWHKSDILGDLGGYVGVDVDGPGPIPPLTEDSILAVAHLGGKGGARKFIETGGKYNPGDSNGTRLSDYATMHAGGHPQQNSAEVIAALSAASANPWVAQKYGPVIDAMMGQQMSRADAAYEQQLKQQDPMYQAKLAQLTAPAPVDPWSNTQVINGQVVQMGPDGPQVIGDFRDQEQGWVDLSPEQVEAMGLEPGAWQRGPDNQLRKAGGGGVTVNNQLGADEFDKAFSKGDAAVVNAATEAGISAQRNLARLDQLETLLDRSPTGAGAALRQYAGEFGINTEGLSEIQAAEALINSMVPEQRPPGSGTMSDADLALFKRSLPRIINQPGGNKQIIETLRGIAQYDAEGARIVQRMRAGELTRAQGIAALQNRRNPLSGFKAPQGGNDPSRGGRDFSQMDETNIWDVDISSLTSDEMDAFESRLKELGL